VIDRGVPLDGLLDEASGFQHFRRLEPRDRGLVRAILGVALRRRGEIFVALERCLNKPLAPDSGELEAILHVGAAQILFLDVPDRAAVDLAVTQAANGKKTHDARGLVNSVLRRISREKAEILETPGAAARNIPDWLRARWTEAYGADAVEKIAAAHSVQPPLDVTAFRDKDLWAERLGGILLPQGSIRLAAGGRIAALPGYEEGAWWVQDAAAALPAQLLGKIAGKAVADLCAAPGGKTAQLVAAGARVTAVDISVNRLKRLSANLKRLSMHGDKSGPSGGSSPNRSWEIMQAQPVNANVMDWEPPSPFDAVLLDAPCTATGTIRRHPDIAWLKRQSDIDTLARVQHDMLDRAAGFVAPGGRLVYCTCSLETEEGEAQVAPFLAAHPDFSAEPIRAEEIGGLSHLLTPDGFLRTLPFHDPGHDLGPDVAATGMDGFFAARFRRNP
jgi:16S rRNA (cytosine967-C5)-methyltransferase